MKKILAILMTVFMGLSLVGCSSKEEYELTRIYANGKWSTISSEITGTLVFEDSDWSEGTIQVDLGSSVYNFHLEYTEHYKGDPCFKVTQKTNSLVSEGMGRKLENGMVAIIIYNNNGSVGFEFKEK